MLVGAFPVVFALAARAATRHAEALLLPSHMDLIAEPQRPAMACITRVAVWNSASLLQHALQADFQT
jgi:hypothetical protein